MKILIVEDEARIARRIERLSRDILQDRITQLVVLDKLHLATDYLQQHSIDLLLLDLNLSGQDGFELLKPFLAASFATIVISAYRHKAIEAFEYGVLDFIPKPFDRARLEKAFQRYLDADSHREFSCKYLAVKKQGSIQLIEVEEIIYIKAADIYTQLHVRMGRYMLSDKSLRAQLQILPPHFAHIHKSYIANMREAQEMRTLPGSKYELILKNGVSLPIGRTRYKVIRQLYFS